MPETTEINIEFGDPDNMIAWDKKKFYEVLSGKANYAWVNGRLFFAGSGPPGSNCFVNYFAPPECRTPFTAFQLDMVGAIFLREIGK